MRILTYQYKKLYSRIENKVLLYYTFIASMHDRLNLASSQENVSCIRRYQRRDLLSSHISNTCVSIVRLGMRWEIRRIYGLASDLYLLTRKRVKFRKKCKDLPVRCNLFFLKTRNIADVLNLESEIDKNMCQFIYYDELWKLFTIVTFIFVHSIIHESFKIDFLLTLQ